MIVKLALPKPEAESRKPKCQSGSMVAGGWEAGGGWMKAAPGEASENAVVVTPATGATVTPRRVPIAPSLEVSASKGLARASRAREASPEFRQIRPLPARTLR